MADDPQEHFFGEALEAAGDVLVSLLERIALSALGAEERLASLRADCERPEVVSDGPRLVALAREIEEAQAEVDRLYARWAELSA